MTSPQLTSYKYTGYFFILWIMFQGTYSTAKYFQHQYEASLFTLNIEKRIALDISKLRLANPIFNTISHPPSVKRYIDQLNLHLTEQDSNVKLLKLQNVSIDIDGEYLTRNSTLTPTGQKIEVSIAVFKWPYLTTLTPIALFLALIFTYLDYKIYAKANNADNNLSEPSAPDSPVKLSINLHDKTLNNVKFGKKVELSNKPFCFYVALLEYCIKEPNPLLNQSKNVPEDIIALANKYFYRLIEIGHTKRKRPDFSTNLDKTLSEIRATLDAVFLHQPHEKELFYPPKAQGEGSRSKLHNYALEHIDPSHLEIIGK
ncbi:MAG: hypothetical protein ABJH28_09035 [Paraglaciecola sp.]|uniref:hypothetical protein n=1 Tax=Paraglaciecola sp. TaxID=1920173 RepID=UPI00326364F3